MQFSWDDSKNKANQEKHGLSFEDVIPVFSDEWSIVRPDPDHTEERWVILGTARYLVVVVAVYSYRDDIIRIISARKATAKERRSYEEK
ncbi:MAG TPA: BrnT family toxin [Oligoflexus sp.]|uniref:BrnT family toxin n=1 Tax=Oligoflexus sp. TaxID=1971216 RepID=UPI002D60C35D|nr:BrnT family toxin [Oligoflexus sp.]HYX34648.1 BrnT family toxin [Oligoflexus sp.]